MSLNQTRRLSRNIKANQMQQMNPYPPITHPHSSSCTQSNSIKFSLKLSCQRVEKMTCTLWYLFLEAEIFHFYYSVCCQNQISKDVLCNLVCASFHDSVFCHARLQKCLQAFLQSDFGPTPRTMPSMTNA